MKKSRAVVLASALCLFWCASARGGAQQPAKTTVYTLTTTDGEQSIAVTDERTVSKNWAPFPSESSFGSYQQGRLARDAVIRTYGASLHVAKGTPIAFASWSSRMSACSWILGQDTPITLGDSSAVFKAETELCVERWWIAGTIAEAATTRVDETSIACAAGSWLAFERWALRGARLAGGSLVTHGGRQLPCAGLALFRVQDGQRTVYVTIGQDVDLRLGGGVVPCPSGSTVYYEGGVMRDITFSRDVTIDFKGKPHAVAKGQTARLDDQGNVAEIIRLY